MKIVGSPLAIQLVGSLHQCKLLAHSIRHRLPLINFFGYKKCGFDSRHVHHVFLFRSMSVAIALAILESLTNDYQGHVV